MEYKVKKINGLYGKYNFNPGIINYCTNNYIINNDSKILLSYRYCDNHKNTVKNNKSFLDTRLGFAVLNSKFEIIDSNKIDTISLTGVEDPRLFSFKNNKFVSYTYLNDKNNFTPEIFLTQINDDLKQVKTYNFIYNQVKAEKNWLFFEHNKELHFIYKIYPLIINKVDENGTISCVKNYPYILNYGYIRGGAPPLLINNEYHCFVHSNDYSIYDIVLDYNNFNIIKISKKFNKFKSINFPCGAVYNIDNNNFYISCGIDDKDSYMIKINEKEIIYN